MDEEVEEELFQLELLGGLSTIIQEERSYYIRDRLLWNQHVQKLLEEGPTAFDRVYRMSYESFKKLVEIIKPHLKVEEKMTMLCTGKPPISPELQLHCLICWLSGGSYLDIRLTAGMSVCTFYRSIERCLEAILKAPELAYAFPTDYEEAARNFRSISSHGAITGCVACVDGYFLEIQTPGASETGNVKAYYSGHYQAYGINIQAACDYRCRFVSVCVAAPGSTNDIVAFRKTSLSQMIQNLPLGKYVIGDNAYACSEHLLTPFSGADRLEPKHDNYNFYLSQVRIRIEMAFGYMTQKWQILRKPLKTKLKNTGKVFLVITRLHNFCINKGNIDLTSNKEMDLQSNRQHANGDTSTSALMLPVILSVRSVNGTSIMRERVVEHIFNKGLQRPN